VGCSGLQSCSVLQRAAVCCSVLQCVAVCCSVLQCVAAIKRPADPLPALLSATVDRTLPHRL